MIAHDSFNQPRTQQCPEQELTSATERRASGERGEPAKAELRSDEGIRR